jgi:hypothetical protein
VRNYFRVRHLRGDDVPHATSVPFVMPLGDLGLVSTSGPALSTGPGSSVENRRGPQARGGGSGNAPGPTAGGSFRKISIGHTLTKQECRRFVGRIVDAIDKEAGGVSALQHQAAVHLGRLVVPGPCSWALNLASGGAATQG